MTQHTKGEWRYEKGTETIRSVPENYWIASMNSFEGSIDKEKCAHLIASAPDLLIVAQLAAELMENIEANDKLTEHENRLLVEARAAIANVKGK